MMNSTNIKRYGFSALLVFAVLLASPFAYSQGEDSQDNYLTLGVGHVAVFDSGVDDPGVIKLEYRFNAFSSWKLYPAIGVGRSYNNASFLFAVLEKDFYFGRHWVATPSFGLGMFDDGEDVQLGNELEFRSGVSVAYQFENRVRFGLGIFHLSNGGISETNPGTEPLFLHLSLPL